MEIRDPFEYTGKNRVGFYELKDPSLVSGGDIYHG
jgi:hypothetical protein